MIIPKSYTKDLDKLCHEENSVIMEYLRQNFTAEIFYNSEIMGVMKNIFFDMSCIYEALEVLEGAGIDFTLSLVGGALRDFFSGHYETIKDLDIVLSINTVEEKTDKNNPNKKINTEDNLVLKEYVDVCKNKYKDWSSFSIDKKLASIIEATLAKHLNVKQTFLPLDLSKKIQSNEALGSKYQNMMLRGVIKLEDERLNYPADILICNASAEDYVDTFDFNICKIMLSISSEQFKKMLLNFNWEKLELLKNQIVPSNVFWVDLVYKKLTLNPVGLNIKSLEKSMQDHLPRIQNKYPNHVLDTLSYNKSTLIDADVKNYLEKRNDFILLGEKIPRKDEITKKKLVKI